MFEVLKPIIDEVEKAGWSGELIWHFTQAIYTIGEATPELELTKYRNTLEENGLNWDKQALREANYKSMTSKGVFAMIIGIIRADRFAEGTVEEFANDGTMLNWIKQLIEFDN